MGVAHFCLWADLKPEDVAALDAVSNEDGTRQVLASALGLVPEDNQLRHEVLLEFFVNNVRFARENDFSIEKVSTFFSIMKRNHDEMCEAFLPMEKSWEYFKALVLAHAVQRPPHSVGVFTLKEVQLITDYALNTYYRHFKLFRCAVHRCRCALAVTPAQHLQRFLLPSFPPPPRHLPAHARRYAFTMRHEKHITTRSCLTELPPTTFYPLIDGNEAEPEPEPEPEAEAAPPPEMPEVKLDVDVPEEVKKAVEEQIAAQVSAMREMLEAQYAERFARHEAKITALEGK